MGLCGNQLLIKLLAILKSRSGHSLGRTHRSHRLGRLGDQERPVLAAEESGGVKRLKLFAFA